jgi:hypothetical protein
MTRLDLSSVLDGTRPEVEARLSALAREPAPNLEIAAWVTEVFPRFPFDSWRLAVASRCIGVALLHGAPAQAFAFSDVPGLPGPVRAYRAPALAAALAFHRRRTTGPAPAGRAPVHAEIATLTRDALQASWLALAAYRSPTNLPTLLEWLDKGPATHVIGWGAARVPHERHVHPRRGGDDLRATPATGPRPGRAPLKGRAFSSQRAS